MTTVDYRPAEVLAWAARHRGPVFSVPAGRRRITYLLGPEANAAVFAHDRHFHVREVMRGLIPVDGETALIVTDGPDHPRRRALVRPGLHQRQVDGYVRVMADTADDALAEVADGESFDAYALFRSAIRRSTMRSLFGDEIASRADAFGRDLQPLLDLVELLPDVIDLHARLNTPRWRRAMAARARIDAVVYDEIAKARRAGPGSAHNVLATLVHGKDEEGSGLTDLEIRDQVVSLIAAGYETTSGAMAWTVYSVGVDPDLQRRVRAEILDTTGGDAPTAADLPRMPLLSACVTESLRLYPPATISARHVVDGFEHAGHRIREGSWVVYSPYVTHRDPAVYDDPRTFLPERWLEQPKRPPSEYLPFGGGAHRCIGSAMATTELTVMLARLLARGRVTIDAQRVRPTAFAALRPRDGLRVRLGPHDEP